MLSKLTHQVHVNQVMMAVQIITDSYFFRVQPGILSAASLWELFVASMAA